MSTRTPGLVIELREDEGFMIEVPSSVDPQSISIQLDEKSGQRARIRVVAPSSVRVERVRAHEKVRG